jgi:hypothetical protein
MKFAYVVKVIFGRFKRYTDKGNPCHPSPLSGREDVSLLGGRSRGLWRRFTAAEISKQSNEK